MEMKRIGSDKIRILLTLEDMRKFRMDWDSFDYQNAESRRILWELFAIAREETGFDAVGECLCVKMFPKKNGGCEFLVSAQRQNAFEREGQQGYLFSSVDDLLAFRSRLSREHRKCWKKTVVLEDGRICLLLSCVPRSLEKLLLEYAEPLSGKYLEYHLHQLGES